MEFLLTVSCKLATCMLQVVIQELTSPVTKEVGHIWNVDKKLKSLLATYEKIQALVDRWESDRQFSSTTIEAWLQELEGYCYDTEDLVDYLTLVCTIRNHSLRKEIMKSFSIKGLAVPRMIVKLEKELKRVSLQIEDVLKAGHNSNSQAPSAAYGSPLLDKTPLVSSSVRDKEKENIIMELISTKACGVSIIGMDGLGKTTLARTILTDARIKNHFSVILSACVSGDFQVEVIIQKLAQVQAGNSTTLIVLDDLWSVTVEDWFHFKYNYLNLSPNWKILTTTRNPKVAEVTNTVACYLDSMNDEDSKEVIMQRAVFCDSDRETWNDDMEIIAKKCKGMPVVAHRLGLVLSTKHRVDQLRNTIKQFKNNDLWKLPEFRQVFPMLKLNEPKFPADLKRCFAYCSLFSPRHRFNKDELVQLWEVEGFVRSEPTAVDCFDQLLSRSILKPLKSTIEDEQTMYEMHEFNHVFAQHLASSAFHRIDEGKTIFPSSYEKTLRHLSLICESIDVKLLEKIEKCTKLRTFLLLHQKEPKRRAMSYNFVSKLEKLRLLDLSYTNLSKLETIKQLELLRYLNLSNTDIQTLPDSICDLRALRILKLEDCVKLDRLPRRLNQLISLTHLLVNMRHLARLPAKLRTLTNLEVLSSYTVGRNEGSKVVELEKMENLKEICISRVENISDKEEAEKSRLSTKQQLERLILEWDNPTAEMANASDVLEGLTPHHGLKELVLRNYRCQQFPAWLISPVRELESIYLQNCPDCEALPSFGLLRDLKILVLHSIDKVEKVDGQFCGQDEPGFRHLESLEFSEMGSLLSWSGLRSSDMPCLHTLKIIACPKLACLPTLIHQNFLVYLEINNCPALELLPEIPSSMNKEGGKLIIIDSPLVEERCQVGGADWPKIKNMVFYRENLQAITTTSFSVQPLPTSKLVLTLKRCVSMLKRHNRGGHFYRLYWVFLVVVMLIPILLSIVIYHYILEIKKRCSSCC